MKPKKIPLRKCLITNELYPKSEMIRVVLNKEEGLLVDVTGKKNGRGAYLKLSPDNIVKAKKRNLFEKTFGLRDIDYIYKDLEDLLNE
jgi:predicted RNA-binding protein YlxR (DUF448 family)